MDSIGDKLRSEREKKSLSVEQIARDTNIARRFISALEEEDFSVFPGDPYLIGFLRNYSEYLGLDPEEMVSLYRNFTIQSQPVPMEELLDRSRPKRLRIRIFVIVFVVAALAVGGVLLYPVIFGEKEEGPVEEVSEEPLPEGTRYELDGQDLDRRFIETDVVAVSIGDDVYELEVSEIADSVTLAVPSGTSVMRIGDERAVDLDGDTKVDISIALSDIDTGVTPASAMMRFSRLSDEGVVSSANSSVIGESPSVVGNPALSSRLVQPVVIARSDDQRPFSCRIQFQGYCLFRYIIDGDQRVERYFQNNDYLTLDVGREIRMWASNGGNVDLRVDGIALDFGGAGEVSTRIIGWKLEENTGQYLLSLNPMY